jgi:signal transduction histidine kinase
MIAMLGLLMTQSRPDQRLPLGKMRAGGQQLLLTIDNLAELTQIDERAPHLRQIDIAAILRAAVRNARGAAEDSGIGIELDCHLGQEQQGAFVACADSWMTRRILDNMLFNAIRVTRPAQSICVSIRQDTRAVIVAVDDAGADLPKPPVDPALGPTAGMVASLMTPQVGVGLTLSRRLAAVMGGSLRIDPVAGVGTTAILALPLAAAAATP